MDVIIKVFYMDSILFTSAAFKLCLNLVKEVIFFHFQLFFSCLM